MKLHVDPDVCQGYGLCHDEAPELLALDDSGFAVVLSDADVPADLVAVAEKAVSMCPARALGLG
ncbi:MAG TPA: ferredoxin [Candidatus Nanopelagicales bacterium]|nr:ferredoxin [Candidatus Nanopelagicales bacterium]